MGLEPTRPSMSIGQHPPHFSPQSLCATPLVIVILAACAPLVRAELDARRYTRKSVHSRMDTSIISKSWVLLISTAIVEVIDLNLLSVLVSIVTKSGGPRASVGAIVVESSLSSGLCAAVAVVAERIVGEQAAQTDECS